MIKKPKPKTHIWWTVAYKGRPLASYAREYQKLSKIAFEKSIIHPIILKDSLKYKLVKIKVEVVE